MDSSATPPAEIICLDASVGNQGWPSKPTGVRKRGGAGLPYPWKVTY